MVLIFKLFISFITLYLSLIIYAQENSDSRFNKDIKTQGTPKRDDTYYCKAFSNMRIHLYDIPTNLLNEVEINGNIIRFETQEECSYPPDPGYYTEFTIYEELKIRSSILTFPKHHSNNYYFIPQFPVCALHNCRFNQKVNGNTSEFFCYDVATKYVNKIMNYIIYSFPFFNNSRGADHFLINAFDSSIVLFNKDPSLLRKLENVLTIQNLAYINPPLGDNSKDLLIVSPMQKSFISMLPSTPYEELKYFQNFWNISDMTNLQKNFNNRKIKVYFRGAQPDPEVSWSYLYSHGIRQQMFNIFTELKRPDYVIDGNKLDNFNDYMKELLNSKLCLNPEGYMPWSTKLSRLLNTGCVPLFIADGIILPYEKSIDWKSISFKVKRDLLMNKEKFINYLNNITDKDIFLKFNRLFQMRNNFFYTKTGKSGALCHLLHELGLKLKTISLRMSLNEY